MNGKIADNYDVLDEMKEDLIKLRDQLRNITAPEAQLDEESRNLLLSAPDSITTEVEKRLSEKLEKFSVRLDDVLKDAESSVKKAADGGTSKVTNAVNSAKGEISGFVFHRGHHLGYPRIRNGHLAVFVGHQCQE